MVEKTSVQDYGQDKDAMDDKDMPDYMKRDLLSPEQVVNNALTTITAGHQEVGTALTWVVYFLILHPEVRTRQRHEITSTLGDQSDWNDQAFTEDDFNKVTDLRAVINESRRLRPKVPIIWRESTTPFTPLHPAIPHGGIIITAST